MATTALNVQTITEGGMTPANPVNGDNVNANHFANTGKQWIEAAGTGTFTVAFGYQVRGQTIPAKQYTAPCRVGTFDPSLYGSKLVITPSASTVTLNVFQLG